MQNDLSELLVFMFLMEIKLLINLYKPNKAPPPASEGPVLPVQHYAARLTFATEHQNWHDGRWRPVVSPDESRFGLSSCDRRHSLSGLSHLSHELSLNLMIKLFLNSLVLLPVFQSLVTISPIRRLFTCMNYANMATLKLRSNYSHPLY